jgi:hypothetical protein
MKQELVPNDRESIERQLRNTVVAKNLSDVGVVASLLLAPFTSGLTLIPAAFNGAVSYVSRSREQQAIGKLDILDNQEQISSDQEPGSPLPPPNI